MIRPSQTVRDSWATASRLGLCRMKALPTGELGLAGTKGSAAAGIRLRLTVPGEQATDWTSGEPVASGWFATGRVLGIPFPDLCRIAAGAGAFPAPLA